MQFRRPVSSMDDASLASDDLQNSPSPTLNNRRSRWEPESEESKTSRGGFNRGIDGPEPSVQSYAFRPAGTNHRAARMLFGDSRASGSSYCEEGNAMPHRNAYRNAGDAFNDGENEESDSDSYQVERRQLSFENDDESKYGGFETIVTRLKLESGEEDPGDKASDPYVESARRGVQQLRFCPPAARTKEDDMCDSDEEKSSPSRYRLADADQSYAVRSYGDCDDTISHENWDRENILGQIQETVRFNRKRGNLGQQSYSNSTPDSSPGVFNSAQEFPCMISPVPSRKGTPSPVGTPSGSSAGREQIFSPERKPLWSVVKSPQTARYASGEDFCDRRSSLQMTKELWNTNGKVRGSGSTPVTPCLRSFKAISSIGQGAFSVVFKAQSKEDNKFYAIKKSKKPFQHAKDRELMLHEVEALQLLSGCDYIVGFERAWQEDGYLYQQTELCELGNLDTLKKRVFFLGKHFPDNAVWSIMHDVGTGLHFIHSHSFVHLDIKPSNLFLCSSGIVKIGDFGLAVTSTSRDVEEGDQRYMAQELLNNLEGKSSADIFSLGLTLYEIAAEMKEMPMCGSDWLALREGNAAPLPGYRSRELANTISWMMKPNETERPSAEEIGRRAKAKVDPSDCFLLRNGLDASLSSPNCPAIKEVDEAHTSQENVRATILSKLGEDPRALPTPNPPRWHPEACG